MSLARMKLRKLPPLFAVLWAASSLFIGSSIAADNKVTKDAKDAVRSPVKGAEKPKSTSAPDSGKPAAPKNSSLTSEQQWTKAKLIESQKCISGDCPVSWKESVLDVEIEDDSDPLMPVVVLRGKVNQADWGLTDYDGAIAVDPKTSEFSIRIKLRSEITRGVIYAVGPLAEMEEVHFVVVFDGLEVLRSSRRKESIAVQNARFSASLGVTSQSYLETGIKPFSQTALTGKISFQNPWEWPWPTLAPQWMIGASAYLTLLPFSTSAPETEMRFLGANARLGYRIGGLPQGWNLTLWGGFYYTTMIVSVPVGKSSFGLQNLTGPQFFPTLSKKINSRSSISGYAKLAPVAADGFTLSFPAKEIAAGVSYSRAFSPVLLTISLDLAKLSGDIAGSSIDSTSSSLSLGLSW